MKFVLQRVRYARVRVGDRVISEIGPGLLVLLCIEKGDVAERLRYWARRIPVLRIFNDEAGKMNRSLRDVDGAVMVVSQFTLSANLAEKGRRPSFIRSEAPERARPLIAEFVQELKNQGLEVAEGEFGAMMLVELGNDGPVTFMVDEPPPGASV